MPDTGTDPSKVNLGDRELVVVMGAYYPNPDDPRYAAALDTLRAYQRLGQQHPDFKVAVIVVDASPNAVNTQIRTAFSSLGAIVLPAARGGITPQNLQGLQFAFDHGARVAMRQEPEKPGLAQIDNLVRIVAAVRSGHHLVVIGRDEETVHSMPYEQQITEAIMSLLIASLGLPLDSAAGPRAMDAEGFRLVASFNYEVIGEQWEFLWWPLLEALYRGWDIGYVEAKFPYPESLTEQEELSPEFISKRLSQAYMILAKLLAEAAGGYDICPRYLPDIAEAQHQPLWRRFVVRILGRQS